MRELRNPLFSIEFFDLQLRFAAKVAELSGASFAQAVASHTNLYVRLAMGPQLDAGNPDWQDFLAGLVEARDPAEWTHSVHRQRLDLPTGPVLSASVGCFSYAVVEPGIARLHFHAGDARLESPLSPGHARLRREELRALLAGLKAAHGSNVWLVGASWLYNLPSYRRLFPEPYLDSLRALEHPYQRLPLWGQLLRRDRSVRPETASRFVASVAQAVSIAALSTCFPLPVLTARAPVGRLLDAEPEPS